MGIKNSTAPIPVEITKSEVLPFQSTTLNDGNGTHMIFQNGDLSRNTTLVSASKPIRSNYIRNHMELRNRHKIVTTFGKLREISTLVLKNGVPREGANNQNAHYEIYETLSETLLFRAEQNQSWRSGWCFAWSKYPILIYDNYTGSEIAKLSFSARTMEGHHSQVIEISSHDTTIGYIQTVTTKLESHGILDEKFTTIFAVERKTLGFKCSEYLVKTVSAIEVSVCVATVKTPREGKVFTEMHSSLSATYKALLMGFSLYLLTLHREQ